MKVLKRNKQTIYYALFDKKTPTVDEYGNQTGEYKINYKNFVPLKVNVSAGRGDSTIDSFGVNLNYDKVLVTCDKTCPIDENTIICLDIEPNNTTHDYDYIVTKVSPSINSISIAITKVDVS